MQEHAVGFGAKSRESRCRASRWLLAAPLMVFLLSLLSACSAWKESFDEPLKLPTQRLAPDSIGLEITFVRVPAGQTELNEHIWQQIDEQCLDAQSRTYLNRNGFRAGLVGTQLPDSLRQLLDEQRQTTGLDQLVSSQTDVLAQNRQLQSRAGQRNEIVASPPLPKIVVLKSTKPGNVAGETFDNGQCIIAVRSFPQSDGSVRLELTPEIHHGEPQSQWIAGEGTFHFLSGRKREVYADLKTQLTLSPGESVVLSSTVDVKGLGENFFVESGRGASQQKYFLIRVSQTQRDELFDGPAKKKSTAGSQES